MTPDPLPPLAETIAPTLAFARMTNNRGAIAALEAVLTVVPDYDAELARLRGLLREALPFLTELDGQLGGAAPECPELTDLLRRIQEAAP